MDADVIEPGAPRILARELFEHQAFWTSGKSGVLSLPRLKSTGRFVHPFWNVDESDPDVEIAAVSGRGSVFTYTVNMQAYNPAVQPPYVIAIVQLDEQDDLRIATNIVGCAPDQVSTNMRVKVAFEPQGNIYVPVFVPDTD